MRLFDGILLAALCATLTGCLSGQTGSPDCAAPYTCACQSIINRYVFRARVVDVRDSELEVEVEEDYSSRPSPVLGAGARAVGRFTVGPDTCRASGEFPRPVPGDTVLVGLVMAWGSGDYHMWVVPWTDPVDLVDRQIPAAELRDFVSRDYCDSDLPRIPCDDEGVATCAHSPHSGSEGSTSVASVLALAVVLLRRARIRAIPRLNPRPARSP